MTLLASVIVNRVRNTLVDPNGTGWDDAELYDYLSAAESAVCNAKPDAYTVMDDLPLTAGVVQALPADAIQLFSLYFNTVSGAICTQVGVELQNQANRAWPANPMQADVEEYMTDARNPRRFLVNPPNDGTGTVMAFYGAEPPPFDSAAPSQALNIPDTYQTALWAYVCALAYAKNTKRQDVVKSNAMLGLFNQLLGLRTVGQQVTQPVLSNTEPR